MKERKDAISMFTRKNISTYLSSTEPDARRYEEEEEEEEEEKKERFLQRFHGFPPNKSA